MRAVTVLHRSVPHLVLTRVSRAHSLRQVPITRPDWVLPRRQQIGHRIAALRVEQGMSVDDLASASELDRKSVLRAEHASASTGIDVLLQLAHGLGVPLAQLVEEPQPPR